MSSDRNRNSLSIASVCAGALIASTIGMALAADRIAWPAGLPVYDHILIVIEENKDVAQILGAGANAPYFKQLATEGAVFERMYGAEHYSQGNYFWLFSGSNHNVGFFDRVPTRENNPNYPFQAGNLGSELIRKGLSFKGYAESLPAIGSEVEVDPPNCRGNACVYARKHVPWISFANVPNGTTVETSSNLRFADFPSDYSKLPTVAFVIPDMEHDMHNGAPKESVPAGDLWLKQNLDAYYQWAKTHNSLLIVTFDENDDKTGITGLTDPAIDPDHDQSRHDRQNRIATIFAGAFIKPNYVEPSGTTHVNILRTLEVMYGLPKSGAQQPNALRAGISDD